MASTGRMTRSKGPSDGVSLPPYSRPRKSVYTETGKQEGMTGEPGHQADVHEQRLGYKRLQAIQVGHRNQVLLVQVRITPICFLPRL